MRLGYVWIGPGALTEEQQRVALRSLGCAEKDIAKDVAPSRKERNFMLSLVRPGDELCVVASRYFASDAGELHRLLAQAGKQSGAVYFMSSGAAFTSTPELAEMTTEFVEDGNSEQTRKARERHAQLPQGRKGGRPAKALPKGREDEFVQLCHVKGQTYRHLARTFQTSVRVVKRWAEERGLPQLK